MTCVIHSCQEKIKHYFFESDDKEKNGFVFLSLISVSDTVYFPFKMTEENL